MGPVFPVCTGQLREVMLRMFCVELSNFISTLVSVCLFMSARRKLLRLLDGGRVYAWHPRVWKLSTQQLYLWQPAGFAPGSMAILDHLPSKTISAARI